MSPWLLLTVLVAAINLTGLLVIRGRWGRIVAVLLPAAILGTMAGDAAGSALGIDLLRLGDFRVLAASAGAQLAMLVVLLAAALLPAEAGSEER